MLWRGKIQALKSECLPLTGGMSPLSVRARPSPPRWGPSCCFPSLTLEGKGHAKSLDMNSGAHEAGDVNSQVSVRGALLEASDGCTPSGHPPQPRGRTEESPCFRDEARSPSPTAFTRVFRTLKTNSFWVAAVFTVTEPKERRAV